MSDSGDQVADQARFVAREFIARWARETGEVLSAIVTDRMLFACEMGYLRGRTDGTRDAMRVHQGPRVSAQERDSLGVDNELPQACAACAKGEEEDK